MVRYPIILSIFLTILGYSPAIGQRVDSLKKSADTTARKYDSLKAVVVTAAIRPRMLGDTLEYNTTSIRLRSNEVVEELLRRLPGLHVDPDGTITYNGEKIQHLLIDGEDVTMGNPTMVTRTFDADKIARIQVIDRRSNQSLFTDVDDGTRTKTLNLVLKNDAKNSIFGKAEFGGNTGGDYHGDFNASSFVKKQQWMSWGVVTNTGVSQAAYAGGGQTAGNSFLFDFSDPLGAIAGIGIPKYTSEALHYANLWNGSADHLSCNYHFGSGYSQPLTSTESLQIEPDSVLGQQQVMQSINRIQEQSVDAVWDVAIPHGSAFRFNLHGLTSQMQNQLDATSSSTFNTILVNNIIRNIHDETDRKKFGGDISWRIHTSKGTQNVLFITGNFADNTISTNGYLYSVEHFYEPNSRLQSIDTIDEREQLTEHTLSIGGTLNYVQQIIKGLKAVVSYGVSTHQDEPLQNVYNKEEGNYQQLVDSLSSDLKTLTVNQSEVVNLQGNARGLTYTIGITRMDDLYHQQDIYADSAVQLHFIAWSPRLAVYLTPKPTFHIDFNFGTTAQLPSPAQLESIKNNSNPLFITVGNPNLKPGNSSNFGLDVRWLKAWIINVNGYFSLISNNISTMTITDSFGRQISRPMNVNGGQTAALNFSVDHRIAGIDWNLHTSGTYSRTANYVNADISENEAYTGGGGIGASLIIQDQLKFQFHSNFIYTYSSSSINSNTRVEYWSQNHSGTIACYSIPHLEIGSSVLYTAQQKTSNFAGNAAVCLWNAYIVRTAMHDRMEIKAIWNNMLNANAGVTRSSGSNISSQTTTNMLGQYWMLNIAYHFDKRLKKK